MYKDNEENITSVEIETDVLRGSRARREGRFLKGPIPLFDIGAAARLPGKVLTIFLAVHHQTALTGKPAVTLPKSLLQDLGISKDAKARAVAALEAAGLIEVVRASGCAVRVGLAASFISRARRS